MGESHGLLLLVTMAAIATLPFSVTADVIKVPDIPVDCAPPDVCATLRFYDSDGNLLDWTQGTEMMMKVKNVAKVQQVGTGSYTVFKGRNHGSESACLSGNNMIDLKSEAYYEATVVKSVRYEHGICQQSKAGVPLWLVGAVIGVVALVAVAIFLVMLRKRRAALQEEPLPTEA